MASYNLGTARGQIEIVYDSNGTAHARADVRNLKEAIDEVSRNVAEVHVQDAQAQARIDGILRGLQELNRQRADPSVNLSDADARREMERLQNELLKLDQDSINPNVNIHIDERSRAQLRAVEQQLEALNRLTADPRVDIDTQLANARIAETRRNLNELSRQRATPTVDVDTRGAADKLAGLKLNLIGLAISFIPALIPIAAGLTAVLGALGGAATAAAAGVGLVFGAFKVLKIAADPAIAQQIKGIQTQFTSMATSIKPQLLDATSTALRGVHNVLGQLQPVFTGAGNAVQALSHQWEALSNSPAMHNFTAFLGRQAGPAIQTFGNLVIKGITGVMGVFQAFEPIIKPVEDAIGRFADKFAAWGQGLANNNGFKSFLDYARTNGPKVVNFIKDLWNGLTALLSALAPLGPPMLQFVDNVVNLIKNLANNKGFRDFVDQLGQVIDKVNQIVQKLGPAITDSIGGNLGNVGKLIHDILLPALTTANGLLDQIIGKKGSALGGPSTGKGKDPKGGLSLNLQDLLGAANQNTSAIFDWIGGALKGSMANTETILGTTFGLLKSNIKIAIESLRAFYTDMYAVGSWIVTGLLHGLESFYTDLAHFATEIYHWIVDGVKSLFGISSPSTVMMQIGMDIVQGLINGLQSLIGGIAGIIGSIGSAIGTAFLTLFGGLTNALVTAGSAIGGFFMGLPGQIASLTATAGTWLLNTGYSVMSGLMSGMSTAWGVVAGFLAGLPARIQGWLVNAGSWLIGHGSAAISGLRNGMASAQGFVAGFLGGLPGRIQGWLSGAFGWLIGHGSAALQGLRNGMSNAQGAVAGFLGGLPGRIRGWLAGAGGWLVSHGSAAMNGLRNGMSSAYGAVSGFVGSIPGRIRGALGGLGGLLVGAGESLMNGLGAGIRSAAQGVFNFVSSIAGKIRSLKGPIPYDRKVLIDNGVALMLGLERGLRKQFAAVQNYAASMAPQIADAFGGASMHATVGAAAAGAALASRTPIVNVNTPQVAPGRTFAPVFQYVGPLNEELVNESRRLDDWDAGL